MDIGILEDIQRSIRSSPNIIFKLGSDGASVCGVDFEEGFQQTTPLEFVNTGTLYEIHAGYFKN